MTTALPEVARPVIIDATTDDSFSTNGNRPAVILDGNNVEEGRAILNELNHPLVTQVDTMDGAADKAAELANA